MTNFFPSALNEGEMRVMKKSNTILLLDSNNESKIINALLNRGFLVSIHHKMQRALQKLFHEKFAAIFISSDFSNDGDMLEFVLNARDVEVQIPIFIIGNLAYKQEEKVLLKLPNTYHYDTMKELENIEIQEIIN